MSEIAPPSDSRRPFRLPADYYCAPAVDLKPLVPPWISLGCGWASAFFLALLFAGASFFAGGRFGQFMDVVLGMMLGEMRQMYSSDVSDEQKKALESEIDQLRTNVRTEKLPVARLDPVVKGVREVSADQKITSEEMDRLSTIVREANRPPSKPAR